MKWRKLCGIGALVFLAVAANLLVWKQDPFSLPVMAPLAAALLLGCLWIALVFIGAAKHSTSGGRAVGGLNAVVSSVVFLGICIVIYAFFQAWGVSWDLTKEGRRDLSPQTIQVLQTMTQEVKVTCFFLNVDDELVLIGRDKTLRFLDQCMKYTSLLKLEVLDPHIDRARLEAMNITHASTQGTVVLRAGGRQKVITLSGGSPRLEERDFTNALINVLRNAQPKVCFLTGHSERDILNSDETSGGSMLKNLLEGESYQTERIAIKISAPEVPQDCDLLVMNNLQSDLQPQEIQAVQSYLDRGGRLLLLLDPWKQVRPGSAGGEQLRPWLKDRYGIDVGSNIVISDKQKNIWQAELSADNAPFEGLDQGFMQYHGSFSADHPITRGFDQNMLLEAVRTVTPADPLPKGVVVTELLRTTPDFWAETDVAKLADTGQFKKDDTEPSGPLSVAVAVTARGTPAEGGAAPRDTRLVVVGDSDFASNGRLKIPGHVNFILNTVAWLTESEDLIAIRPTGKEDTPLILTPLQERTVTWISTLLTVQLVAAAGLVVFLIRRKNR